MTDTTGTALDVPAAGTYRIDPAGSTVRYTGKHLFGTGTVHATFDVRAGEVVVADPPEATRATLVVDAGSFTSDKARRDRDVRSARFLDAANHPDITFRSDYLEAAGEGWTVTGTVTAHGQQVPVTVRVDRTTPEGDGFRVHAVAERLDRTAFGITGGRGLAGRYLDLDLDLLARPT